MWNLSLFFYLATVFDTDEKNAATFLSLFTGNVLTFLLKLYQPFSNLHWHFPCCKYLALTHKNIKNWIQKIKVKPKKNCVWLEKRIGELRVIAQTLDSAFGFLWRFQNLNGFFGWVFESLDRLFWNKYSAYFFDHRETMTIFANLVCKKYIDTSIYI